MKRYPKTRADRIAAAATLLIGRDPDDQNEPESGWQARLSRAMGLGRTAVNDTLAVPNSDVFDRKLADYIESRRTRLYEEEADLAMIEADLRGTSVGLSRPWIVEITDVQTHSINVIWARHPGELAATMLLDEVEEWDAMQNADIFYDDGSATARLGERRVAVRHVRTGAQPIRQEYFDKGRARLAPRGRARQRQIID